MPAKPLYRFHLQVGELILDADAPVGDGECRLRVKRKGSPETSGDVNVAGAQAFAATLSTAARLARGQSPFLHAVSYAKGHAAAADCDFTLHVTPAVGSGHNVQLSLGSSSQRAEQVKDEELDELASFFSDLGQALAGTAGGAEDEGHGPGPRSRLSPLGE